MGKSKELAELGDAVTVDGSNIGIGTSSPSEELEIASSSPTIRLTDTNDSTHGAVSYNVGALFLTADQTVRFNTNDTERMRIDSSGNLLVGTTAYTGNTTNTGGGIIEGGLIFGSVTGGAAGVFNRLNSDGTIMLIRKNGATVGSIGVNNSTNFYQASNAGAGLKMGSTNIVPSNASGASNNNAIDLGSSSTRFKDVHAVNYYGDGSNLTGVGASTSTGAVGTYAYLIATAANISVTPGNSYAGSGLRYAAQSSNSITSASGYCVTHTHSSAPSGTWRAMGGRTQAGSYTYIATLYVRIS